MQESDTVQDLLDRYMNDPEKKDFEYIMFDVNADGIEEIIFTDNGKIAEIYGMRNSKPNLTVVCHESLDMTLYPKGMLRAQSNEKSEYDTKDMWMQYFPDLKSWTKNTIRSALITLATKRSGRSTAPLQI